MLRLRSHNLKILVTSEIELSRKPVSKIKKYTGNARGQFRETLGDCTGTFEPS
jgi:hypothetical protein